MESIPSSELFRCWAAEGDRWAREELVHRHLPLARKLAARYARTHEPFEDLYQVACLGLLNAIDRFDPERGLAFTSFAVPTILGQLKRHFRDKGWPVHLPRGLQELVLKVQTAEERLEEENGRPPTITQIAEHLRCDPEAVLEALDARDALRGGSLDAPAEAASEDEPGSRHDLIGAEDERYDLVDVQASVARAMDQLSAERREILLLQFKGLTQRDIASRVGISQMQVSRIIRGIRAAIANELGLEPEVRASNLPAPPPAGGLPIGRAHPGSRAQS